MATTCLLDPGVWRLEEEEDEGVRTWKSARCGASKGQNYDTQRRKHTRMHTSCQIADRPFITSIINVIIVINLSFGPLLLLLLLDTRVLEKLMMLRDLYTWYLPLQASIYLSPSSYTASKKKALFAPALHLQDGAKKKHDPSHVPSPSPDTTKRKPLTASEATTPPQSHHHHPSPPL